MKTKIRNYGTIALFTAFTFLAVAVSAGEGNGGGPSADLKYVGVLKNNPVFQLDLNSSEVKDYTIAIKDVFGNVLYKESVTAKNFTRKFQLDTNEIDDEVLTVEVRAGKNGKPEVFTINRNTRVIEEPVITRP